jgi:hypothetical protein
MKPLTVIILFSSTVTGSTLSVIVSAETAVSRTSKSLITRDDETDTEDESLRMARYHLHANRNTGCESSEIRYLGAASLGNCFANSSLNLLNTYTEDAISRLLTRLRTPTPTTPATPATPLLTSDF